MSSIKSHKATDEQQEEMDALEAIFMDEYKVISTCPPCFKIHLRDPGSHDAECGGLDLTSEGLPSRHYYLIFTLPFDYPSSRLSSSVALYGLESDAPVPSVEIVGPLGGKDARRDALSRRIREVAIDALDSTQSGCIFQMVEEAKDFIDNKMPLVQSSNRIGLDGCSNASSSSSPSPNLNGINPTAPSFLSPSTVSPPPPPPPPPPLASHGIINKGRIEFNTSIAKSSSTDQWYHREEAEGKLVAAAMAEAAANASWRTFGDTSEFYGEYDDDGFDNDDDGDLGNDDSESSDNKEIRQGRKGHNTLLENALKKAHLGSDPDTDGGVGEGKEDLMFGSDFSAWNQKGRWDYVVGLVGKPSAGKSTFFNAVTDPATDEEGSKVGAFPFTTIAPVVGRGYALVPDPSPGLGLPILACRPTHGFAPSFDLTRLRAAQNNAEPLRRWAAAAVDAGLAEAGQGADPRASQQTDQKPSQATFKIRWRKVPVLIKDVAGLVPGAYQGRGRGNAFLNDLCDADVLIHVVDVSGSTDREGQCVEKGEGADPLDEIGWVREELHRWVFANVKDKWYNVLRKPARLPDLFSGYRASRALVAAVLAKVGIHVSSLSVEGASLAHWGEAEVHRLVAFFLQARFPILLALNKADVAPVAAKNVTRVVKALPNQPSIAVSAAAERWLCQERRKGTLQYSDGGSEVVFLGAEEREGGEEGEKGEEEKGREEKGRKEEAKQDKKGENKSKEGKKYTTAKKTNTGNETKHPEIINNPKTTLIESETNNNNNSNNHSSQNNSNSQLRKKLDYVREHVLKVFGSTGALAALTCAIAMRPPVVVYPVADMASCVSIPARVLSGGVAGVLGTGLDAKMRYADGGNPGVLRDAVLMKPGSSSVDLLSVLKRAPYQMLEGDFVRSECRTYALAHTKAAEWGKVDGSGSISHDNGDKKGSVDSGVSVNCPGSHSDNNSNSNNNDGKKRKENASTSTMNLTMSATPFSSLALSQPPQWRVLKKDESIDFSNCVVRVMTNRRINWQNKHLAS